MFEPSPTKLRGNPWAGVSGTGRVASKRKFPDQRGYDTRILRIRVDELVQARQQIPAGMTASDLFATHLTSGTGLLIECDIRSISWHLQEYTSLMNEPLSLQCYRSPLIHGLEQKVTADKDEYGSQEQRPPFPGKT